MTSDIDILARLEEREENRPLTSASNLHRRKECSGSARMEASIPKEVEQNTPESRIGKLLHLATECGDFKNLSEYEAWSVQKARELEAKAMAEVFGDREAEINQEIALDLTLSDGTVLPRFGRADMIAVGGGWVFASDRKFGWRMATPADANLQARAYIVMAVDHFNAIRGGIGAIVQPRMPAEYRFSWVKYTLDDVERARQEITDILKACEDPNAPLVAGTAQCFYCRAKPICAANRAFVDEVQTVHSSNIMDPELMAEYLRKARNAKRWIESIEYHAKLMWKNGVRLPGFKEKKGNRVRTVTNTGAAFQAIGNEVGGWEGFAGGCKVNIGDMTKIIAKAQGVTELKAKKQIEELLTEAGCLEITENEFSLVED